MKKLTLTIICALAMTGVAFAQGTVNWSTISAFTMTAQTNSTQWSPVFPSLEGSATGSGAIGDVAGNVSYASGSGFYFELLYNTSFTGSQVAAPDAATLLGGTWLDTGLTATNSSIPGRLASVNPSLSATVPWSSGTTNNIMLVGWSANLGSSWTTVSNDLATYLFLSYTTGDIFFGESATGYISPSATGASFGTAVFGTAATSQGLPINSLNTQLYILPATTTLAPEPSTIALAGLGGFSLLLFRRRK